MLWLLLTDGCEEREDGFQNNSCAGEESLGMGWEGVDQLGQARRAALSAETSEYKVLWLLLLTDGCEERE